jgi:hypothetical protein
MWSKKWAFPSGSHVTSTNPSHFSSREKISKAPSSRESADTVSHADQRRPTVE